MIGNDLFEDIPDFWALAFHQLLGALDGLDITFLFEFHDNKGFEKLQCHSLGETALMQSQLRTHDDNRTTGIIDALAEQVLAETTLLAFEQIRE